MKILVVFTGGTIGSSVSDGWISPSDDMKYLLINKYREISGDNTPFDTIEPYTILSENLCAGNLNMLINCVRANIGKYDGIIITHGSDTLQYSASALAYAVGCGSAPVVLVASNYPLEDERANGLYNFVAAVEFIKAEQGRGVFVSYKNKNGAVQIHTANRTVSHAEANDELFSIDAQPFAFFDGRIVINENYKKSGCSTVGEDTEYCENPRILAINVLPGENYNYDLSQYNAVIFRPYHSGTLNTDSENLRNFCNRAKEVSVPMFIVNSPGGVTYSSSKEYENLGITVLPMCGFPAVYMKLWLAISGNKPIVPFARKCIAEEFLHN